MSESSDSVSTAAHALYAANLADFVATRTDLAKQARARGEREAAAAIRELRKPTRAAWIINQVVRREPTVIEQAVALGQRLRTAQSALDAAAIRDLRPERDALVSEIVQACERHTELAAEAAASIRETVIAALADPHAEEAAWSGTLTRPLHYSGFGEVDISDAVARTSNGTVLRSITGGRVAGQEDDADDGAGHKATPREDEEGSGTDQSVQDEERERQERARERRAALERLCKEIAEQEEIATTLSREEGNARAAESHVLEEWHEVQRRLETQRATRERLASQLSEARERLDQLRAQHRSQRNTADESEGS